MVTWFAGLFYLPRLYVYHAQAEDQISKDRFKIMERKLFWGIMTPGAVLTVLFGVLLIEYHGMSYWLNMNILLAIYINNILQEPGEAYVFDGGTTFEFTTAPEANDNIAVFFYKGTASEDVAVIDTVPTLKTGDVVQLQANDDTSSLTNANTRFIQDLQQRKRGCYGKICLLCLTKAL